MVKYFSPAGVNLLGEQLAGSNVNALGIAINCGVEGLVKLRTDQIIKFYSKDFPIEKSYEYEIGTEIKKTGEWFDSLLGVISELNRQGFELTQGFDLEIKSNAFSKEFTTLSSSFEILIIKILNDLNNLMIEKEQFAFIGQVAEKEFIRKEQNWGISSQFIIATALKEKVVFLNTRTYEFANIDIKLRGYQLIVLDPAKKDESINELYKLRHEEVKIAAAKIKEHLKVNNLADTSLGELEDNRALVTRDEYKRIRYLVTEQERISKSIKLLAEDKIKEFGKILNESHQSLKNDYEISNYELDEMVRLAGKYGAIGAKMINFKENRYVIAIVPEKKMRHFENSILADYSKATTLKGTIHTVEINNGVELERSKHE